MLSCSETVSISPSIPIEVPFNNVGLSFECALQPPVHHLQMWSGKHKSSCQGKRVPQKERDLDRRKRDKPLTDCKITLADLFRSKSLLRNSITLKQRSFGAGPTWQHRLLYKPRFYTGENAQFYIKITTQFNDLWCPVLPALDAQGSGVCAHVTLPFALQTTRINSHQFSKFLEDNSFDYGLAVAQGQRSAPTRGFYPEVSGEQDLTRASTSMTNAASDGTSPLRSDTPRLLATNCHHSTESGIQPRTNSANDGEVETNYGNGHLLKSFFGLSTVGHNCRLVCNHKSVPPNTCGQGRVEHDFGPTPSYYSCEVENMRAAVRRNEVMGISGKMHLPEQLEGRPQQIILLFGGKDMLALDWLPNVAQLFHYYAMNATKENSHHQSVPEGDERRVADPPSYFTYNFNTTVVMFEYPGYGFSVGSSTPATFREHAFGVINRLLDPLFNLDLIIEISVVGYSLGSGMAIEAANHILRIQNPQTRATITLTDLILIATPTNIGDCATQLINFPRVVEPLIGKIVNLFDRRDLAWDNALGLQELVDYVLDHKLGTNAHPRIMFLHGDEDKLVKPNLSQQLYNMVRERIERHYASASGNHALTAPITTILNDVAYKMIAGASHWTIVGESVNLNCVFHQLYKPKCVFS